MGALTNLGYPSSLGSTWGWILGVVPFPAPGEGEGGADRLGLEGPESTDLHAVQMCGDCESATCENER